MASHELIDAQFDRAVQIVQGLPKTGPIQTDYEEKLEMYSLYKQATVGNVKSPKPGIWDMLGRAKWDAWAKHKDLDTYEAKWLYVEALLKVLRKYSDKTIARDLVQELESYGGDPGNLVVSGSFSRAPGSDSSGSTAGDESEDEAHHYVGSRDATRHLQDNGEPASEDEETEDDEARELPNLRNPAYYDNRPQSAQSSNRYRTPLGGSLLISPTPDLHRVPSTQPQPNFETPSAFAAPLPAGYPNPYPSHYSDTPRRATSSPHDSRHTASVYRGQYGHDRPPSRPTLEHAIENVQAHLAALTERIESLETRVLSRTHSPRGGNSPRWLANRGAQPGDPDEPHWDINDLGLWSVVLNPLSKGVDQLKEWAVLFSRDETRSPAKAIIRRLVLDISFLLCVLAVVRAVWRRSGVRRREVKAALVILWRALIGAGGSRQGRSMSDKAV